MAFKHGLVSFKLPGCPFKQGSGGAFSRSSEKACIYGKVLILRVLEEMDKLGYNYLLSSDLARTVDNGAMIFRKSPRVPVSRPWRKCLCITPLDFDKLILIRCPENAQEAVRFSIGKAWPKGITYAREESISSLNASSTESSSENIFKIKLKGKPWSNSWASNVDEDICSRKLIIEIVKNLEGLGWKFFAEVNLKGASDSLYFIYDPESASQREEYGMICFNRSDRLRLIDFDENPNVTSTVIRSLVNDYRAKHPQTQESSGTTEFKLDGNPFLATGKEVVESRLMIAGVLAAVRELGYQVVAGFDLSRKPEDKTSILFRKQGGEGNFLLHACIAPFDENVLHLINFPSDIRQELHEVVEQYYPYGIQSETYITPHCLEIRLNGRPWNDSFGGHGRRTDNFHARSMMMLLLKKANRYGWELILSADLSGRHKTGKIKGSSRKDHGLDVHTWFFCFHGVQYYYQSQTDYPPSYQQASK